MSALRMQARLQLPRIVDLHGEIEATAAETLLYALASELPTTDEWTTGVDVDSPTGLIFSADLPAAEAERVMRRFHYLRSPRTDGHAYGLYTRKRQLAVLCYVSPLDVPPVARLLKEHGASPETARVVSRVFAFEDAPRNSISYLLARVGFAESSDGVTDLITYVNPNMEFTGASYRSAGWTMLGQEFGTRYRYLNERYITDRELARQYGTRDDAGYRQLLQSQFEVSRIPLLPLLIFHKHLQRIVGQRIGPRREGSGASGHQEASQKPGSPTGAAGDRR
jgi:hypothetical protein